MHTALKLIAFLARKVIGIAIVLTLIVMATFISYDMANIYVVLNDGMSDRAEVIIHREKPDNLDRFFTLRYLNTDPALYSEQFKDYNVQDYDYQLKIKKMWVWPWESATEVTVEEFIPESSWRFTITDEFRDRLTAAQMPPEEEESEETGEDDNSELAPTEKPEFKLEIPKPQWQNGEKIVEFRKIDGQWSINGIVFVKALSHEQENVDTQD